MIVKINILKEGSYEGRPHVYKEVENRESLYWLVSLGLGSTRG